MEIKCPYCGSDEHKLVKTIPDKDIMGEVMVCKQCGENYLVEYLWAVHEVYKIGSTPRYLHVPIEDKFWRKDWFA